MMASARATANQTSGDIRIGDFTPNAAGIPAHRALQLHIEMRIIGIHI